ncbi:MAG: hypothetical protein B6U72_04170 [Candidatus Altiarchaeales archaeon ex4484_2]|nr:MAG: hypothetical protein B6U72_04170 [Candidatus Altiarchaeales archaeon ex4484_2]
MFALPYVPSGKELIDKAFGRGRRKAKAARSKRGPKADRILNSELVRIDAVGSIIEHELQSIIKMYPSYDQLPAFYQKLLNLKVDKNRYKQKLGQIQGALNVARKLQTKAVKENRRNLDTEASTRYLGRVAALIKKITPALDELRDIRDILKTFPTIKELPTLVVAGYPNVGKSTFTRNLTGSKIKIAWYPFTTTEILIGYTLIKHNRFQIIDTPGLLDRPMEDRNKTEQQAILAIKELADKVLFIIEPSSQLSEQLTLYNEIKEKLQLELHAVVNRKETTPEEEIKKALEEFNTTKIINALDQKECRMLFLELFKGVWT